ncbi:hypothetical protein MKW98_029519 [Papaver atlanticum]|uniref:SKP1 component POZ domain-containing protein n=1 Tax=Papaver atlanticum TaxID=357466 RepID=A0AAD4SKG9_9MAGN|nr:hypothetical protein MKW98_029519 [Papaver atlanticum]
MSAAPAKMITLNSSDEESFVIEESIALQSKTLEHMITDKEIDENTIIYLTKYIRGNTLAKVIAYLNKHGEAEIGNEDKKIWGAQFMKFDVRTNTKLLFDMSMAAYFLNIKGLMDLKDKK